MSRAVAGALAVLLTGVALSACGPAGDDGQEGDAVSRERRVDYGQHPEQVADLYLP